MKPLVKVTFALALLVSIGSAAQAAVGKKTDPTLSKIAADWAAGFNAKDCAKVASLYAEDGVLMPPNEPAARGRTAIETWCKAALGSLSDMAVTPAESAITGAQAFEAGSYTASIKGASPAATDRGKYVTVFQQSGGRWQILYDIFNSDLPAAPPPKP